MRLACLLAFLPLAAQAETSLTPLFGAWGETTEACDSDRTWVLGESSLNIGGDGGQTCGYLPVEGKALTLDLLCPIAGETMQASARRITLAPDGSDRLSVDENGQTRALQRCPEGK